MTLEGLRQYWWTEYGMDDSVYKADDNYLRVSDVKALLAARPEVEAFEKALYLLEVCYETCDLIYDAYGAFPEIGREADVTIKDKVGEFLHQHGRAQWDKKPEPQNGKE